MEEDRVRSESECLSTSDVSTQDETHEADPSCPSSPSPLPQDWVAVGHNSGGTVYLHKPTRACTWARPYCVPLSKKVKQHSVPLECLPCLHQSLVGPASHSLVERWLSAKGGEKAKLARIDPRTLREYLLLRWSTDDLSGPTSKDAKRSTEDVSAMVSPLPEKETECVAVSSEVAAPTDGDASDMSTDKDSEGAGKGTIVDSEGTDKGTDMGGEGTEKGSDKGSEGANKRNLSSVKDCSSLLVPKHLRKLVLERTGKSVPKVWSMGSALQSPLALLNDFCRGTLKTKPDIATHECNRKGEPPYSASISLDSIWYGSGTGSNKKQAKQDAAEAVLDVLFDGVFKKQEVAVTSLAESPVKAEVDRCKVACSPWQILKCCLMRNRDTLPSKDAISLDTHSSSSDQLMFSMSLGDHCHVEGPCVDGVEPRDAAAEALLLKLHPYVKDWPTLTRMYSGCADSVEGESRKRQHTEDEEGGDRSGAPSKRGKWPSQSDTSLLERLKVEMKALSREYEATQGPSDFTTKTMLLDTDSPGFSSFSA